MVSPMIELGDSIRAAGWSHALEKGCVSCRPAIRCVRTAAKQNYCVVLRLLGWVQFFASANSHRANFGCAKYHFRYPQ